MGEDDNQRHTDREAEKAQQVEQHAINAGHKAEEKKAAKEKTKDRAAQVGHRLKNAYRIFSTNATVVIAMASVIAAGVAVWAVIENMQYSAALLREQRRDNAALLGEQHRANVLSLRPYLVVDGYVFKPLGPTSMQIFLTWHNAGKIPALSVVEQFSFITWDTDFPSLPDKIEDTVAEGKATAKYTPTDWVVAPGATMRTMKPVTFGPREFANMFRRYGWVLTFRAEYTDSFEGNYSTEYCAYEVGGTHADACPTHNAMH